MKKNLFIGLGVNFGIVWCFMWFHDLLVINFSRAIETMDFWESRIRETLVYYFLDDVIGLYRSTAINTWYVIFIIGLVAAWMLRARTAILIEAIIRKV
ncbi:hypothetical protein [Alteromonas sp. 009811495]|uniref:hypothetical protein n=1 Tax=Alteromonas sp. 009811495 TaxID=3002962 RepID=UPI00237ED75C|nr:hypothetical protein [Alteromonas sp. 009811495]WDT85988.1 hypothetical protein OZ660_18960 [Alteromonas sp. 009811495]